MKRRSFLKGLTALLPTAAVVANAEPDDVYLAPDVDIDYTQFEDAEPDRDLTRTSWQPYVEGAECGRVFADLPMPDGTTYNCSFLTYGPGPLQVTLKDEHGAFILTAELEFPSVGPGETIFAHVASYSYEPPR